MVDLRGDGVFPNALIDASLSAALIYLHSTSERQRAIADAVGEAAKAALRKAKPAEATDKPSGTEVARRRGKAAPRSPADDEKAG